MAKAAYKPESFLFDLDGTTADCSWRNPYDTKLAGSDPPHQDIVDLVQVMSKHWKPIAISGREKKFYILTRDWLVKHEIEPDSLLMRADGDRRPDEIVKRELYVGEIAPYYDIRYVIDDRNKVVKMWRGLGLRVLHVADGNF